MGKVTGRAKGQRLYLSWSKICSRVEGGGGGGGQKLKSRLGPATGMALWGISGEEEKKVIVVSVNNADNIITHRIGIYFYYGYSCVRSRSLWGVSLGDVFVLLVKGARADEKVGGGEGGPERQPNDNSW